MCDNKKQNLENHASLNLLHDIFKLATVIKPYLPAFLNAICDDELKAEEKEIKECDNKYCNVYKDNTFKSCKTSFHYDNDNGLIYKICYYGIDVKIVDNNEQFLKWLNKIYKQYFLTAYKINISKNNIKNNTKRINCILFEFYAEDDEKTNLAATPWYWDTEMSTFFHEHENGDKYYVRYLNQDGQISVCENEDGTIAIDIISDIDRQMFVTSLKNSIDNLSSCDEKYDNLSYNNTDLHSGTDLDNNIDDFFNDIFDDKEKDEDKDECCCEHNKCNNEYCINDKEKNYKSTDLEETLGDIVCSYGYNVRGQSIHNTNKKNNNSYSPEIKKIYKDILYKESTNEERIFTDKEMIKLFDYMLDNRQYEYSISDSKVVISICYEDMMKNIDKPNYETLQTSAKSNLPWFMINTPKFTPISWKELNKQAFVDNICQHYNFDEVLLIDMPNASEECSTADKHCILCTFNVM